MKLTLDLLNKLLKPFSITIKREHYYFDHYDYYYSLQPFTSFLCVPDGQSMRCVYTFNTLVEVFDNIVQAIDIELSNGSRVKNPYFNCNNLEEMLIKKDLLYGNI